jgi:uncharacterized protein (TIGR02147 family)
MKQPLVSLIENELSRMKLRNSAYSLRAFAKRLRVNPSALSEILSGKRLPTLRFGQQVVASLNLPAGERKALLESLFNKNTSSRVRALRAGAPYTQIEQDQYEVIGKWYYFAILSLAETRGFQPSPAWVARRLGLGEEDARAAIACLVRLGLLKQRAGKLRPTGKQLATTSGVPNPAIRRAHFQNIDLIEGALGSVPLEHQDFGAMTVATSPAKLAEAKDRIKVFRRELASFLESGPKEEVYNFSFFLFPLTKVEDKTPRKGKNP